MTFRVKDFLNKYYMEILLAGVTLLASIIIFWWSDLRFPNDDQFILFRYIDNIVEGKGFVYNEGERVLGATTPLFTLVAALFKYIFPFVSTPDIVAYLNIIFLTIGAIFFWKIAERFFTRNIAILATSIFALNMSRTIPEGMETPLFLLTALAFIYYLLREKYYLSSIFLAFAILTRPDAGLIAIIAVIYWWQKIGLRMTIRLVIITTSVVLPWAIFATIYFGSFVPQSLMTKLHSSEIYNLPALQALKIQAAHLSRIYWGKIFDPDSIPLQVVFNLIPFLFLVVLGAMKRVSRSNWVIFVIPLLYISSFSLSNPIIFPWYLSQMEPFWILVSLFGFAFILERFKNHYLRILLIIIIAIGPFVSWIKLAATEDRGSKMAAFSVGSYIREHMKDSDTVGLADIGIVGYISEAYIVDFIGLINTDSVSYYPIRDGCRDKRELYVIPPELIIQKIPNWLVAGDRSLTSCFITSDWFKDNYTFVYSSGGAKVWRRNH